VGGAAQAARVIVTREEPTIAGDEVGTERSADGPMVEGAVRSPARALRGLSVLIVLGGSLLCLTAGAAEADHLQPLLDRPADLLAAEPRWIGVISVAVAMIPLLLGWWLIRWTTALITAGAVGAAVLFALHGRLAAEWLWTATLCCAALGGILGWFLYPVLFALQMAVIAGGTTYGLVATAVPSLPLLAGVAAAVAAIAGGLFGLRLAPWAAIAQTVFTGFAGVLIGMIILCRPHGDGERLVLALVVGLITIPLGAWVQARAHRRAQQL
jgi:hypothetical protein